MRSNPCAGLEGNLTCERKSAHVVIASLSFFLPKGIAGGPHTLENPHPHVLTAAEKSTRGVSREPCQTSQLPAQPQTKGTGPTPPLDSSGVGEAVTVSGGGKGGQRGSTFATGERTMRRRPGKASAASQLESGEDGGPEEGVRAGEGSEAGGVQRDPWHGYIESTQPVRVERCGR